MRDATKRELRVFEGPLALVLLTLTVLAPPVVAADVERGSARAAAPTYPEVPMAVASFGSALVGDHLYAYSGHVGRTHQHSIENLADGFWRLDLRADAEGGWESLPVDRPLQGLAMVAHGGHVYRLGGLSARNHQGDDEDLVSVADVARFDPATGAWTALTPLPTPRSSHNAAVLGDHVYVVGGWTLRGAGKDGVWLEDAWVADLTADPLVWETLPTQPFARRALAVVAGQGRVYAIGGLGQEGGPTNRVDVYDPARRTWSKGPDLPVIEGLKGFGTDGFGAEDGVFASGTDGHLYRLTDDAGAWLRSDATLSQPRFFHRAEHHTDGRVFFVAGASRQGHLASVETMNLETVSFRPSDAVGRSSAVAADGHEVSRWPGFRGHGPGHTPARALPTAWGDDHNLGWRARLPGYGQSSPVVWDGQVFATSVEGPEKETLIVSALSLDDGSVRWRRRLPATTTQESSEQYARAAPTPAVDAEHVYVFFESGDLFAFDHDGAIRWQHDLTGGRGPFEGNHGIASSPVLGDEGLYLLVTHDGPSSLLKLDKTSGEVIWKRVRPSMTAWSTPLVLDDEHETLVISAAGTVEALDGATGDRRWWVEGLERNHIPSPTVTDELVVIGASAQGSNLAIRRHGEGDVSASRIAWRTEAVNSAFGSPVAHGDCVYFANRSGVLTCADRETGDSRWVHRLPSAPWASPIVAGDHVYFFGKSGDATVLGVGDDAAAVVASNTLSLDATVYGVAAADGAILIRTGTELIRVGTVPASPPAAGAQTQRVPNAGRR